MEKVTATITIDKTTREAIDLLRKKEKRSFSGMCNILLSEIVKNPKLSQ